MGTVTPITRRGARVDEPPLPGELTLGVADIWKGFSASRRVLLLTYLGRIRFSANLRAFPTLASMTCSKVRVCRKVQALTRRLASTGAVELARLFLHFSDRVTREELLYPALFSTTSAIDWSASVEVVLPQSRPKGAGDKRRCDLRFRRRNEPSEILTEVWVEVSISKTQLSTDQMDNWIAKQRDKVREKYELVVWKPDKERACKRLIVLLAVSSVRGETPVAPREGRRKKEGLIAAANVGGEYPCIAEVHAVCERKTRASKASKRAPARRSRDSAHA